MRCDLRFAALLAALAAQPLATAQLGAEEGQSCLPAESVNNPAAEEAAVVLAEGPTLVAVPVVGQFDVPWAFAFLPDGSFLVTERPGRLQHARPGAETRTVAGTPAVLYLKHGGLLDIAVDPDFATNGLIYLSYLQGEETASTMRILKARFDPESEKLTDEQIIFESTTMPNSELIGGRLALTGDGYLFLSIGYTWRGDPAQDLGDDRGSIIRIRTDGSVPEDNPFVHRPGARPEIWSYGHRNPQGLAYDRVTGQLWSHEHGPRGGDELNLILRGHDYGWPLATYGVDYSGQPIAIDSRQPGTDQPVRYWVPISIAPSGLAVATNAGHTTMYMSTLAGEMVVQLGVVGDCVVSEHHRLKHQLGRVRDVRIDEAGAVHVLSEDGALYRLDPSLGEDEDAKRRL